MDRLHASPRLIRLRQVLVVCAWGFETALIALGTVIGGLLLFSGFNPAAALHAAHNVLDLLIAQEGFEARARLIGIVLVVGILVTGLIRLPALMTLWRSTSTRKLSS